jgi:hypothetical protein
VLQHVALLAHARMQHAHACVDVSVPG